MGCGKSENNHSNIIEPVILFLLTQEQEMGDPFLFLFPQYVRIFYTHSSSVVFAFAIV